MPEFATSGESAMAKPRQRAPCRSLISIVQSGRFDPTLVLTHRFSLDEIGEAYKLFGERLDGVVKVAIRP